MDLLSGSFVPVFGTVRRSFVRETAATSVVFFSHKKQSAELHFNEKVYRIQGNVKIFLSSTERSPFANARILPFEPLLGA
jgi:hypothetical protein